MTRPALYAIWRDSPRGLPCAAGERRFSAATIPPHIAMQCTPPASPTRNAVTRRPAICGNSLRTELAPREAEEVGMAQPTPEERARMAEVPRGTYALMAVVGLLLF